jgi:hypothetical protein
VNIGRPDHPPPVISRRTLFYLNGNGDRLALVDYNISGPMAAWIAHARSANVIEQEVEDGYDIRTVQETLGDETSTRRSAGMS